MVSNHAKVIKNLVLIALFAIMLPQKPLFALQEFLDSLPNVVYTACYMTGSYLPGDTMQLHVTFIPLQDDTLYVGLSFTDDVYPPDRAPGEYRRNEMMIVDSGVSYNKTYNLKLSNWPGSTDLLHRCEPVSWHPGKLRFDPKAMNITWSDIGGAFTVENDEIDDAMDEYFEDLTPNWAEGSNTISIRGFVNYVDEWCVKPYTGSIRSPYTRVRIWFNTPNDPNPENRKKLYHPIPLQNGEYIEGTHYADCDENGKFEFNFSFLRTIYIYQPVDLCIMVCKENDAIKLESPNNHLLVNLEQNNYELHTFPIFRKVTLNPSVTNHVIDFSGGVQEEPNRIMINSSDGQIFRYTTLSRKFVPARFNVSDYSQLPFNDDGEPLNNPNNHLPQIEVKRIFSGNAFYDPGDIKIYYPPDMLDVTIIHEYGHYLDHAMDDFEEIDAPPPNNNGINPEGFAMFYSTAVSAWINNTLGDPWSSYDNCEIAPYCIRSINFELPNIPDWWDRFGCLNKTGGYPNPDYRRMSRFAAFIWNLYDSKSDGDFMAKKFSDEIHGTPTSIPVEEIVQGLNNDDIDGLGLYFFQFWNDNPNVTWQQIGNEFKNTVSDMNLKNSIDLLYDFMDFDLNGIYNYCKPSQVKNFDAICDENNDILNLSWESGSYLNGSYQFPIRNGIRISDNAKFEGSWFTNNIPFSNPEDGYHLYDKNNNQINQQSESSLLYNINQWDCSSSHTGDCFKVSSFMVISSNEIEATYPLVWCPPVQKSAIHLDDNQRVEKNDIIIFPQPASIELIINFNLSINNHIDLILYDLLLREIDKTNINTIGGASSIIKYQIPDFVNNGFYQLLIRFSDKDGKEFQQMHGIHIIK